MTAMDAPVLDPAPRDTARWFKVGQLTEAAIVRFGANPASLYLLLCRRVRYSGEGAGDLVQPYSHEKTAALFGCSLRHIKACLEVLRDNGAVRTTRLAHGVHVTIAGYPRGPLPQITSAPPCTSPDEVRQPAPEPEVECTPVPPSSAPTCTPPILIQESLNQEGGKTPTVDRTTNPARSVADLPPPPVEYVEKLAPARTAIEKELGRSLDDLDPGIHKRLCYELHNLGVPPAVLAAGARRATLRLLTEPQNLTKPYVWKDRVREESLSLDAQARTRERQRAEAPPPADRERDPEAYARSRRAAEAARRTLPWVKTHPGAVA